MSCNQPTGIIGFTGELVKGKSISIKVIFTVPSTYVRPGKMHSIPIIHVRNDSQKKISITPIKITAWFEKSGKLESGTVFGHFDNQTDLLSVSVDIYRKDGTNRQVELDKNTSKLMLYPGENIIIPASLWDFKAELNDGLKKIKVIIGPPESDDHEIFIIKQGSKKEKPKAQKNIYRKVTNGTYSVKVTEAKRMETDPYENIKPEDPNNNFIIVYFETNDPELDYSKIIKDFNRCGVLISSSIIASSCGGGLYSGRTGCMFIVPKSEKDFTFKLDGYPGIKLYFNEVNVK